MRKKIRVGIAGCGKIARVSHVPGLNGVRGVEVVALCDVNAKSARNLQEEQAPEAECFTDFKELLKADLDAAVICTPNDLHYPMATAAFKAGLHVLCDKPIAATLPEAGRMITAAKRAGKVLHINQSLRYHPLYVTIVELVKRGRIGKPIHARCIRAAGRTPDMGWSPGATWFVQKKHQGGVVLDIAIHMADLLRWVMGDVSTVVALVDTRSDHIDVPDNVSALFRFANGSTGVLELSWTTPAGAGLLEIYGTEGKILMGSGDRPVQLTRTTGKTSRTSFPKPKANVKSSQQCFIDAIRGRSPSPTPGKLGRDALALCDAIVKSGRSGRFVKVAKF